jgi:hypothetical protein
MRFGLKLLLLCSHILDSKTSRFVARYDRRLKSHKSVVINGITWCESDYGTTNFCTFCHIFWEQTRSL